MVTVGTQHFVAILGSLVLRELWFHGQMVKWSKGLTISLWFLHPSVLQIVSLCYLAEWIHTVCTVWQHQGASFSDCEEDFILYHIWHVLFSF